MLYLQCCHKNSLKNKLDHIHVLQVLCTNKPLLLAHRAWPLSSILPFESQLLCAPNTYLVILHEWIFMLLCPCSHHSCLGAFPSYPFSLSELICPWVMLFNNSALTSSVDPSWYAIPMYVNWPFSKSGPVFNGKGLRGDMMKGALK